MNKSKKILSSIAIFSIVAASSLGFATDAQAVGVAYYGTRSSSRPFSGGAVTGLSGHVQVTIPATSDSQ